MGPRIFPFGLSAVTLSASVTSNAEACNTSPFAGVVLSISNCPSGSVFMAVKLPVSTEMSLNCRRSIPVRRSTPSGPTTVLPSMSMLRWVTVMTSSLKSSVVPLLSISIW
ncbi:hypothetical protein D9M68_562510 [compost metagenome]